MNVKLSVAHSGHCYTLTIVFLFCFSKKKKSTLANLSGYTDQSIMEKRKSQRNLFNSTSRFRTINLSSVFLLNHFFLHRHIVISSSLHNLENSKMKVTLTMIFKI